MHFYTSYTITHIFCYFNLCISTHAQFSFLLVAAHCATHQSFASTYIRRPVKDQADLMSCFCIFEWIFGRWLEWQYHPNAYNSTTKQENVRLWRFNFSSYCTDICYCWPWSFIFLPRFWLMVYNMIKEMCSDLDRWMTHPIQKYSLHRFWTKRKRLQIYHGAFFSQIKKLGNQT